MKKSNLKELTLRGKVGLFDAPTEEINVEEVVAETAALNEEITQKCLSLICDMDLYQKSCSSRS